MLWRNIKTGVIVDVGSVLGGDWKPVEKKKKTAEEPKPKKAKKGK